MYYSYLMIRLIYLVFLWSNSCIFVVFFNYDYFLFLCQALLLSGWNVTVLMSSHFGFSIQWFALHTNIDRTAMFYLIHIESPEGILLAVETVPGSTTTKKITGLRPSTRYRVGIYGIDETGQAFKSSESLASTTDGKLRPHFPFFFLQYTVENKLVSRTS